MAVQWHPGHCHFSLEGGQGRGDTGETSMSLVSPPGLVKLTGAVEDAFGMVLGIARLQLVAVAGARCGAGTSPARPAWSGRVGRLGGPCWPRMELPVAVTPVPEAGGVAGGAETVCPSGWSGETRQTPEPESSVLC